jgi:peptidyl-tRNA hydrolase, PTH1 family
VIALLGTEEFCRLRIGIAGPADRDAVEHVLSEFAPDERDRVDAAVRKAADAVECWLAEGVAAVMNKFNRAERGDDRQGPETSDEGV